MSEKQNELDKNNKSNEQVLYGGSYIFHFKNLF